MPYQPIIEHYDDGAPIQQDGGQTPNPKGQAYKDASRDYKRMLRAEYYDEDNARGAQSLYYILKVKHPDDGDHPRDHPPKRYVTEWVGRQGKNQVYKKKKGKAKAIQSVIVNKPNELLQVDYVYFSGRSPKTRLLLRSRRDLSGKYGEETDRAPRSSKASI